MLSANKEQWIRRLAAEGHSQRQIAKIVGSSRATVKDCLENPHRRQEMKKRRSSMPRRISILAQADQELLISKYKTTMYNAALFTDLLKRDPVKYGLPADFNLTERSVRRYMSNIVERPTARKLRVINRFEVEVGQQLQIDFTHGTYLFDGDKVARNILVFKAMYTWSHKQFFWICPDMTQASWLRAISECLIRLGIPREILCDNDKSLVISNDGKGKNRFHPDFLFFCKHFGVKPRACKPRRPQTKWGVERAGSYLKTNAFIFVRDQYPNIRTIEELNAALQEWTMETSDAKRVFDSVIDNVEKRRTVAELYAYERQFLTFVSKDNQSLDLTCKMVEVSANGQVFVHGEALQLPSKYIATKVLVVVCADGRYRLSSHDGTELLEGCIAKDKLMKYKFNEAPDSDKESFDDTEELSIDSITKKPDEDVFGAYLIDDSEF